MSRAKLEKLGLTLPLFVTSTVGSFPKPDYLLEGRGKFSRKEISREELDALERRATEFWIKQQEEIGLDVLVDGEQYRGDMVAYFADIMPGFEIGGLVRSYGNRYYHKPIIVGEVKWPGPITVGWWKFAQGLTAKPIKGMLTGPYTIMDWSFNDYYPDRKTACFALATGIRKEVEALVEAGATIIQIDEPALSVRPEELDFALEAMHIVTDNITAYFITHICYGAFEFIYPQMLKLPVDNFDLEMSNSGLDLIGLFEKDPFTKDLSFGVLDVHSHVVETPTVVKERMEKALQVIQPETLWVDPDCGLKTRTVEEAQGKLRAMVAAVREVRQTLGSR
ncbi:MAG: methionine synthase [candidate division NC10 bacterium]|nr:methionine synthase [candidate division NC10 bacterium]